MFSCYGMNIEVVFNHLTVFVFHFRIICNESRRFIGHNMNFLRSVNLILSFAVSLFAIQGTTRKIIPVCRKLTNEIVF
jgi:hypothetical protein